MEKFDLSQIKAGYLLVVEDLEKHETFTMTVVPTRYGEPDTLGCCCPAKHWWPLSQFGKDTLICKSLTTRYAIQRVYGPTCNQALLDNSIADRELLWERKEPKKMTVAEICKALGYDVEIVKEGEA